METTVTLTTEQIEAITRSLRATLHAESFIERQGSAEWKAKIRKSDAFKQRIISKMNAALVR